MDEVVTHKLVGLQPYIHVFKIGMGLRHVLAPLRVRPLRLMQFQSLIDVAGLSRRGDEVAARREVLADLREHLIEVGRGHMFHQDA